MDSPAPRGDIRKGAHRVCAVAHTYYPEDPRVRREAEALRRAGYRVDVVCLRQTGEARTERVEDITVYRMPVRRHRGGSKLVYGVEYAMFALLAALRITVLHLRRGYDLVHVHNLPDFVVFAAAAPKCLGARVILDLHDLTPELYAAKYGPDAPQRLQSAVQWIERLSVGFADHVLTASPLFKQRLIARGVPPEKISVVMNSVDDSCLPTSRNRCSSAEPGRRFLLFYHGTLARRYGLDLAISAVGRLREHIPGIRLDIYGRGEEQEHLETLVADLGLEGHIRFGGYIEASQVMSRAAQADIGIVPLRKNQHMDLAFPTKLFEYVAVGVPALVSRTSAVQCIFSPEAVAYIQPDDVQGIADRALRLYREPDRRDAMAKQALAEYEPYSWSKTREEYLRIVEGLLREGRSPP